MHLSSQRNATRHRKFCEGPIGQTVGTEATSPRDFVDNPRLPGCALVRRGLVAVTLGATALMLGWLLIGLLTQGGLAAIDHAVLEALHSDQDPNDPIGPAWLESAMRDISALGSNTVVACLAIIGGVLLALTHRLGPGVLLVTTTFAAFVINAVLKVLFERDRPDFLSQTLLIETSSFPSSHAMLSTVLYLLMAAIATREIADKRLGTGLIALGTIVAAMVGLTRVYLGAHWPSDVLAGWLIGAGIALAAWQMARAPTSPEDASARRNRSHDLTT